MPFIFPYGAITANIATNAAGVAANLASLNRYIAVASDDLQYSHDTEIGRQDATYVQDRYVEVPRRYMEDSQFRIKFDFKSSSGGTTVYARIYKNGVAHGTEQSRSADSYDTKSEDLYFKAGDLVELWVKGANPVYVYTQNFRIYCADGSIETEAW